MLHALSISQRVAEKLTVPTCRGLCQFHATHNTDKGDVKPHHAAAAAAAARRTTATQDNGHMITADSCELQTFTHLSL